MASKKATSKWAAKTLVEVSQFFGVERGTVTDWRNKGMPGTAGNFPLDEIAQWLRREIWPARNAAKPASSADSDKEELECEKLRIHNAKETLLFQRTAGELVDRRVAMSMLETAFNTVRSRLEQLPEELSVSAPAEHRRDLLADAKQKVTSALRELAAVAEETDL